MAYTSWYSNLIIHRWHRYCRVLNKDIGHCAINIQDTDTVADRLDNEDQA